MKRFYLNILLFFILITLASCGRTSYKYYRYEYNGYLDTVGYIIVEYDQNKYTTKEIDDIFKKSEDVLLNVEKEFSIEQTPYMKASGIEKSTLMIINENSGKNLHVLVSEDFFEVLKLAKDMYTHTEGLFDVSVGSLTTLWQISKKAEYCMNDLESLEYLCGIPSDEEIQTAKDLINYEEIQVDEEAKTVSLVKEGMMLDFGAIGKGYAVEKLAKYLSNYDFPYTIINMGGNIKTVGLPKSSTSPLKIYVKNPFEEGNIGYYYPKTNTGGVTSGIYERYIHYQGVKYHHILNPKTGYPCSDDVVSVTIMGNNSAIADALSTSVFMLGVDKGLELINSLIGYEAVIITKEKEVYVSNNLDFIQEK